MVVPVKWSLLLVVAAFCCGGVAGSARGADTPFQKGQYNGYDDQQRFDFFIERLDKRDASLQNLKFSVDRSIVNIKPSTGETTFVRSVDCDVRLGFCLAAARAIASAKGLEVGAVAPEFACKTFDGGKISLDDSKGGVFAARFLGERFQSVCR